MQHINVCLRLPLPFRPRLCEVLLLILMGLMAASCQTPLYKRSAAICPLPPPPPRCKPGSFNIVMYDTTTKEERESRYWKINRVSGADSEREEYGLLFPSTELALLLTGKDDGNAGYRAMQMTAVDVTADATSEPSTMPIPFIATEVRPGAVMGDATLVHAFASADGVGDAVPLEAPYNLPVYWDGHATISPNGSWMIFASDRPGGLGGTDLWMVRITKGVYGKPRWCGPVVNTPCDEICPQFAPDSLAILFSSAGHSTVGGYDLFRVNISASVDSLVFSSVENIGIPVNTPFDEIFPVQSDAATLYYGSNQSRQGAPYRRDFDVYVLHQVQTGSKVIAPAITQGKATIRGVVIKQQTQEPVPDAEVTAREPSTRTVLSSTKTDSVGRYSLDVPIEVPVDVSAQTSDLFYDGFQITVPAERKDQVVLREQPISLPITYMLRVNFPTSIFDAPYLHTLDSNGIETPQTWTSAVDELAGNVQSSIGRLKRLVLIGHTDDVDSDPSNMKLGKQRVEFIMNELVRKGVPRELMEGRSAGETLKPNKRPQEPLDTWRKRSRRVELVKVLQ